MFVLGFGGLTGLLVEPETAFHVEPKARRASRVIFNECFTVFTRSIFGYQQSFSLLTTRIIMVEVTSISTTAGPQQIQCYASVQDVSLSLKSPYHSTDKNVFWQGLVP